MKNSATIESLKAMRFGAMAAELERQMQDPATYVSGMPDSPSPVRLLRISNTMRTAIWTRPSFCGSPPVTSLQRTTTSFSREPPAMEKPIWPVP